MTPNDDKNDAQGVEILGRWGEVGNAQGSCICRAENYTDVASWAYNWVPMATCPVKPVCDDNVARRIILGKEGSKIKEIGPASRIDLEKIFNKKIFLSLDVKVDKNWDKDPKYFNRLGLEVKKR